MNAMIAKYKHSRLALLLWTALAFTLGALHAAPPPQPPPQMLIQLHLSHVNQDNATDTRMFTITKWSNE